VAESRRKSRGYKPIFILKVIFLIGRSNSYIYEL